MGNKKITLLAIGLACVLTACKSPPDPTITVFGLWPEDPPLRYKPFNTWTGGDAFVWPQLDSAQPTLRWEPFPRPADHLSDTNSLFPQVKSVTYDLRLWRGESDVQISGDLAYARDALPHTLHHVEVPLPRSSWYYWSVRARFELNGQTRITEWSFIEAPKKFIPQHGNINYPDARYFRFYLR